LVYPEIPPTYWSFTYTLPFIGKKASLPPLGLLTVAALLPPSWDLRLVDMNIEPLDDEAIRTADLVLVSAMLIQKESFEAVVRRCNALGVPVAAGGPYPTECHASIAGVDHFILNEAEVTLPRFLEDLEAGAPGHLYRSDERPDLSRTPLPRYDLLRREAYSALALQFSRGCPFDCEFCDIVPLFGRTARVKSAARMMAEFDLLHGLGWRGGLFLVDDNFIGNRKHVLPLLAVMAEWQERHGYPFSLFTEVSIDFAQDDALLALAKRAGFTMVFVGIETPDTATLACIGKRQNTREDMLASVRRIQKHGIEVSGGFIVGFGSDTEDIFDRQIAFIRKSGIVQAMVGLLTVLPSTRLHQRLTAEGRTVSESEGNNTHGLAVNYEPKMGRQTLLDGYKRILRSIYPPRAYFARCLIHLRQVKPNRKAALKVRWTELRAGWRSFTRQPFTFYGVHYLVYLARALSTKPRMFPEAVSLAVKGHHFFQMTRGLLAVDALRARAERVRRAYAARIERARASLDPARALARLARKRERILRRARRRVRGLDRAFRRMGEEILIGLEETLRVSHRAAARPSSRR
jgi:radical SAM superfamily enzyme YgiQ (UPF0313 family)